MQNTENEEFLPDILDDNGILWMIERTFSEKNEMRSLRYGFFEKIFEEISKQDSTDDDLSVERILELSLERISKISDLTFVYICLKYINNPNFYVETNNGIFHILIYASLVLREEFINLFFFMMVLKGSNPELPAYKVESDVIPETVQNWLKKTKNLEIYSTSSQCLENLDVLDQKEKMLIEVAFDLKKSYQYEYFNFILTLRKPLFNKIVRDERLKDHFCLKQTFTAAFKEMFVQILNSGVLPSHLEMYYFVTHIVRLNSLKGTDRIVKELQDMMFEAVRMGSELDTYIYSELYLINPQMASNVANEYQKPIWEKICKIKENNYVPAKMIKQAMYLGEPPTSNKDQICNFFGELTSSDQEKIIRNFIESNTMKLKLRFTQLTKKLPSSINIKNSYLFERNPLEYSEIITEYYKDEDGEIYGFMSRSFENLIYSKVNPYNGRNLPEYFLDSIENKINFLKKNEIPLTFSKTIGNVLNDIKEKQKISSSETDRIVETIFLQLRTLKGYEKNSIKKMPISELNYKFQFDLKNYFSINASKETLEKTGLSSDFINGYFARILLEKLKNGEIDLNRIGNY